MPSIRSTYGDDSVSTVTEGFGGGGASSDPLLASLFRRLAEKSLGPPPSAARPAGLGKNTSVQRQPVVYQSPEGRNNYKDPLAERKALDAYESTRMAAARTPIAGFNYMGYSNGIEKLPSSFRPQGSQFENGGLSSGEMARLNPAVQEQIRRNEEAERKRREEAQYRPYGQA